MEEFNKKIESYKKIIKSVIENWLNRDPILHYASFSHAREFFKKDELIAFSEQAAKNPNPVIQNEFGNIYFELENYEGSIDFYKKAIELDRKRSIYECNLGLTYGELGQWDIAIEHHQKAVELRRTAPTDVYGLDYYYEFLAESYSKAGRLSEFVGFFEGRGDLKDDPDKKAVIYNRIGNLLASAYKDSEAIPYYEKAVDLDNKRPIYKCNLGRAYGNLEQWDKMIEHCKRAVGLRREATTDFYGLDYYYEFLAESYSKAGRLSEFVDLFDRSGDLRDEPEKKAGVYNRIGNLLAGGNQPQQAVHCYEKAIELDSKKPIYESNLGLIYRDLEQWDAMIQHCRKAVELRRSIPTDPYGLDYYYEFLAEAYSKANRLAEFVDFFEGSGDLRDEPEKKAVVYNRIGILLAGNQRYRDSISYYDKAIGLDRMKPIYESNLGLIYRDLEQWDAMIQHCRKAVELRRSIPTDPYGLDYYYEFLAEAYSKANRLAEFVDFFEGSGDLRDEPEKKAVVYNRIGNLFFDAAKDQEAIPYYKKAIDLDNKRPIYECNLGRTYGNLEQRDKMIEHCKKAVELRREALTDPFELDYYYEFLAEAYFKANRLGELAELFEESGDFVIEKEEGKLYKAISFLESQIEIYPENTELKDVIERLKK